MLAATKPTATPLKNGVWSTGLVAVSAGAVMVLTLASRVKINGVESYSIFTKQLAQPEDYHLFQIGLNWESA